MPLQKPPMLPSAQTPGASVAQAEARPAPAASAPTPSERTAAKKGSAYGPKFDTMDATSKKILLQGAFQNALQSVGAVQHGGKTAEDYMARVKQFADACVNYVLEGIS